MKEPMDLLESLFEIKEKFSTDPEVIELIAKLKSKVKELESTAFSEEEKESDEFEEMNDMFYQQMRELDPDDFEIFDVIWWFG
jgi:cytidylate kinase